MSETTLISPDGRTHVATSPAEANNLKARGYREAQPAQPRRATPQQASPPPESTPFFGPEPDSDDADEQSG